MKTKIIVSAFAAILYTGCSDDSGNSSADATATGSGTTTGDGSCEAGAMQCVGMQIQTCSEDGTWGEAADCPEGQMCSEGHEGMDFVHCMDESHTGEATGEHGTGDHGTDMGTGDHGTDMGTGMDTDMGTGMDTDMGTGMDTDAGTTDGDGEG
jgi:hypothetical protein